MGRLTGHEPRSILQFSLGNARKLRVGMIDFFHWEMSLWYDLLVLSKLALTWQHTGNTVKYRWLRLILPVEQYQHVVVFVVKQKLGK